MKRLAVRVQELPFEPPGAGAHNSRNGWGQGGIDAVRLINAMPEPIMFLKPNIEEAGYDAVAVTVEHIRSETSVMAMGPYYNQQDFWRVRRRVLELNGRHSRCVRHYFEGLYGTVMFLVPRRGGGAERSVNSPDRRACARKGDIS